MIKQEEKEERKRRTLIMRFQATLNAEQDRVFLKILKTGAMQ